MDAILVFEVESTATKETKIKPTPFFSFKFRDHINLPGNYNYTMHFVPVKSDAPSVLVNHITALDVTIAREQFVPDQLYIATVSFKLLLYFIISSQIFERCAQKITNE